MIRVVCFFFLILLALSLGEVQVRTSGAGRSRLVASGDSVWYNIEDASCDVTFSAVSLVWGGGNSEALDIFNFSFSVPRGANVTSIRAIWTVSVDQKPAGVAGESAVGLLYRSAEFESPVRAGPSWNVAAMNVTYPVGDPLWGKNWSSEETNDPGFGVTITASSSAGDILFAVKCVLLEIEYSGGEVTSLPATTTTPEMLEASSQSSNGDLFNLPPAAQYVLFSAMALLILMLACGTAWFAVSMGRRKRASMSIAPARLEGLGPYPGGLSIVEIKGVVIKEEIGKGNFGSVYMGLWKDVQVACKLLTDKIVSQEISEEAQTLQQMRHPHVVQFLGVYKNEGNVYMVMEYLKKGDLLRYLREKKPKLANLISLAISCASGCAFIADQGVIHRDIAARNVLVTDKDGELVVKISDVGLARHLKSEEYVSTALNTTPVRWSAPESLKDRTYTYKSDVWGLAVLIWEIFAHGQMPYEKEKSNAKVYDMVVEEKVYLDRPVRCPHSVYAILMTCWNYNPKCRPTADEVHGGLLENTDALGAKIPNEEVYLGNPEEEGNFYNNAIFGRKGE